MYVCVCNGVSDRAVRQCIAEGARTVAQVGNRCGAGTDCGACRGMIRDMIEDAVEASRPSGVVALPILAAQP